MLLLRTVSAPALVHAFASADYRYLLAAVVPFCLIIAVKVTRWVLLFGGDSPRWWTLFGALNAGYAVNTLAPLRIGEIVGAYWVRDLGGISMVRTLGTVAVERVTDGLAVLVILVVFAPTVTFPRVLVGPTIAIGTLLVVGLIVLVVGALASSTERGWLEQLFARARKGRMEVAVRWVGEVLAGAQALRQRGTLAQYIGYTALIWLSNSLLLWLLVRAFHLDVPVSAGFLLTGVLFLGMAVPSSPGYLGVFDYLMVLALSLYHVPRGPAVAAALAAHFVNFVPVTLVGLVLLAHHGGGRAFSLITSRTSAGVVD